MSMKPELFTGARGKIEFTDSSGTKNILAFITDVSVSVQESVRPTMVIGNVGPVTLEPLSVDCNCSVGRIIPINQQNSNALLPKVSGIDYGLEESINNVLSADSVEITIYDTNPAAPSDVVIASVKFARFAGRSFSSSATDIATERYNFVGIYDGAYSNKQVASDINYNFES